jgi:hypothetical protein
MRKRRSIRDEQDLAPHPLNPQDGPTKGRQFYVCARAAGPPGVGRCDCFLWASNWDTKTGTVKKTTGGAGSGAGANSGAGATSGGAKKARRS